MARQAEEGDFISGSKTGKLEQKKCCVLIISRRILKSKLCVVFQLAGRVVSPSAYRGFVAHWETNGFLRGNIMIKNLRGIFGLKGGGEKKFCSVKT